MLLTGVNESAVTLPLSPGGSYDLVFSPVDHVGNREELEGSIVSNSFHVEFPEIQGRKIPATLWGQLFKTSLA